MRIHVSAITRSSSGRVNETKNTIATLIMVSDWVLRLWCDKMESSPDNRRSHTGKEKLRKNKTEYLIYTLKMSVLSYFNFGDYGLPPDGRYRH